jgi:starch synthase
MPEPARRLNILMVAAECVPFAKTGGMADVVGSLPGSLKKLGAEVRIVIPRYGFVDHEYYNLRLSLGTMGVWMGNTQEWCSVYQSRIRDDIPVFLIEHNVFYAREGLYHNHESQEYRDNPKRFAFLSLAALQLCVDTGFKPDIVHANDWHTALLPAYLKLWHWNDPVLGDAASVLTIHNLAYQGIFGKECYNYIGMGEENFTPEKFENYGAVHFLKGGIFFADRVNTVSPGYARETKTPEGGFGLHPYLQKRENHYTGILNGVDYQQWNPETDSLIPANYSVKSLQGKHTCKKVLQQRMALEVNPDIPLIGIVSRFVWQKGLEMLTGCIAHAVNELHVQFAILGSGDRQLESFFGSIPGYFPGRIGSFIGYNDELAHLIEAGSDFFLMPSVYEPCGLNQIYSLKYGTIPIVRATGGLDDTVEEYNAETGSGTGFRFHEISTDALYQAMTRAVRIFYDNSHHMKNLIGNAMKKHFSWDDSASQYMELYRDAMVYKKSMG